MTRNKTVNQIWFQSLEDFEKTIPKCNTGNSAYGAAQGSVLGSILFLV